MFGSCPTTIMSRPYGRHLTRVTRKIRTARSRASPTDCGRAGGYKPSDIREYYRDAQHAPRKT